MQSFTRGFQS